MAKSLLTTLRIMGKHLKFALEAETVRILNLQALEVMGNVRELRDLFPLIPHTDANPQEYLDEIEICMISLVSASLKAEQRIIYIREASKLFSCLVDLVAETAQKQRAVQENPTIWQRQMAGQCNGDHHSLH